MPNNSTYPEVYYKILPYIILVCDQLEANNIVPDQEMLDRISDIIYNDVLDMYPEIGEYARVPDMNGDNAAVPAINLMTQSRNRGFRRRGILRDLIDILLLSELQRRRRRY